MPEILTLSATEFQAGIRRKDFSAREALGVHLDYIDRVNPEINAVVTLDPDAAFAAATHADARQAAGEDLPALHGLPMTHKDTHATRGLRTTQGSAILRENIPAADDLIIERLRGSGVITTGKTNVPEFGVGAHTFNELFGTTTNPYAPTLSAGGSSGGVAAAIAAGIQPLGEGSDMGGSLRIPASFCNVIGFRPSYGVIPRPSPHNRWSWLARTGPMARTIDDIALFMSAVSGPSPLLHAPAPIGPEAFAAPVIGDLTGVRIGWSEDFGIGIPVDERILEVLRAQLMIFADAGAIIEEASIDFGEAELVFEHTRAIDLAAALGPVVRAHRDLIKPETIWNVELGWATTGEDLIRATAARSRLEGAVQGFFERFDLFLSPATQVLPFDAALRYPEEVAGIPTRTYFEWMRSACVLSATGLPVLTLPAGFSADGLPVGLQLAVNHYRDVDLLRYAKAFEDRTRFAWTRPALMADLED